MNFDLICITETHLPGTSNIVMSNYTWFGHNRKCTHFRSRRASGGVGWLIKNELLSDYSFNVIDKSFEGIIALECKHLATNFTMILIGVYLPPENTTWGRESAQFFAHLVMLSYQFTYADLLFICGDMNARISDKPDYIPEVDDMSKRQNIDQSNNSHGDLLIEFLKDTKMCILNGRLTPHMDNFTCVSSKGRSVVDYLCIPHECLRFCDMCKVTTPSEAVDKFNLQRLINNRCKMPDHSLIYSNITINYSVNSHEPRSNTLNYNTWEHLRPPLGIENPTNKRYRFDDIPPNFRNSETWSLAINDIINAREQEINAQNYIDNEYNNLCLVLKQEMDEYLQFSECGRNTKKRWKHSKPYWNEELSELWKSMRNKEKTYLKFRGNRRDKASHLQKFKDSRHNFDKKLRSCERKYYYNKAVEIENLNTSNPKEFWQQIKKLGPVKKSSIPMKVKVGNAFNTDPVTVLNKWKGEYENLYNLPNNPNFDNEFYDNIIQAKSEYEQNATETNDMVNADISYDEIEKLVNKAKNNKSVGIDNIPYEVLKHHDVIMVLFQLFQSYFKYGKIPSIWLKAIITPIPKSAMKDLYSPLQYRGISLLSNICKIYSGLLNSRITNYCEFLDIFVDEQNGFRRNRSCEDHLFSLTSIIQNQIKNRKPVYAAFIDLEKAFDWVDRNLLLYRLLQYNIDGKMYNAVKSLYSQTESCVKINNFITEWFIIKNGVRQGDSLSPTLFSLYINELAKEIKNMNRGINMAGQNISILLYADDMVLITEREQDLQEMLNKMNEWCNQWRIKVNKNKSKIVHFRYNKQQQTKSSFTYGEEVLEMVKEYKYLGIIMDEYLNFNSCSKTLADSGGRALGSIISKCKLIKDIGFRSYSKMYECGVIPIVDYGSAIWGSTKHKHSELIQNKTVRYFLGVHNFTAIPALHGEIGWLPVKYRIYLNKLRLWNRLINMPQERLSKQIFLDIYNINENNWTRELYNIFRQIEMLHVFYDKNVCDLDVCKKKFTELAYNEWKELVIGKPKLRTYVKFKKELCIEKYILNIRNKYERSMVAKLRCGILQLHVESGRFNQTSLENRICNICNDGNIEDEFHFICKCTEYSNERNKLFSQHEVKNNNFRNFSDEDKFIYILENSNRDLAKFIIDSWIKRTAKLYR